MGTPLHWCVMCIVYTLCVVSHFNSWWSIFLPSFFVSLKFEHRFRRETGEEEKYEHTINKVIKGKLFLIGN